MERRNRDGVSGYNQKWRYSMSGKELTIRQIGEFCTNTLCKKCPIRKWNEESGLHNGCMESLRLPAVAKIMLNEIKYRKVNEYDEL